MLSGVRPIFPGDKWPPLHDPPATYIVSNVVIPSFSFFSHARRQFAMKWSRKLVNSSTYIIRFLYIVLLVHFSLLPQLDLMLFFPDARWMIALKFKPCSRQCSQFAPLPGNSYLGLSTTFQPIDASMTNRGWPSTILTLKREMPGDWREAVSKVLIQFGALGGVSTQLPLIFTTFRCP